MRRLLIAVVLVCTARLLTAQHAPDPAQQTPTFRVSTQLIVQTVTVSDRSGKPIEGLTTRDFIITEDGARQDIAFVEYQKLDAAPLGTLDLQRDASVPRAATSTPAPGVSGLTRVGDTLAAAPGDTRYSGKRLIVLYIDLASLSFFDEARVFDGIRKYLQDSMTTADMVSVFVFSDSRVRMAQDFTDDRPLLFNVLDDLERAQLDAEQGIIALDEFRTAFGEDDATFNMFASDRRLSALQTTVTNLGPLPQMKTLIYFGRLSLGVENMAQLRATVNAAVRSNVSINPVDSAGLTAGAPLGSAARSSPGGTGMFSGAMAQASLGRSLRSQDSYYALARDTGGRAFFNNNDLSMGITGAAQAVTGYYLLGYYTKNVAKDGKFRRVKVSLAGARAAGAELSHRAGYYGGKDWSKFNDFDKERQLEEAMRLDDPITDIPMAMEINYFQVSGAEYFVPVSVRMPGRELARARPAGETKVIIDLLGEIKDEYGVTMRNSRDKLEFRLDAASAAQVARKPIQYETGFTVLPGSYTIKMLARDATSGRIGTFITSFVVPNLDRETTRLPISTVIMSSQRVAPADALHTVRQRIPGSVANPLVHDGLQLVPSVTRTFSASQPMFILLEAYERDAASAATASPPAPAGPAAPADRAPRPLVAFVSFFRDGAKVYETRPHPVDTWNPQTRAVPIRLYIAAGALTPAEYDCQVTVLDPGADKSAFWRASVSIVR